MTPVYNYPNTYPMTYPTNPYQKQTDPNNGIVWVQGIEGAKAYQMLPNSNVQLMDSENDGVFYIKVTDNIGMATLRVFRYTEVTSQDLRKDTSPQVDLSEYVKKSELKELISEIVTEKEITHEQPVSTNRKPKALIQG